MKGDVNINRNISAHSFAQNLELCVGKKGDRRPGRE
jgi:hypothetical protein